jgi:hypothetical protein
MASIVHGEFIIVCSGRPGVPGGARAHRPAHGAQAPSGRLGAGSGGRGQLRRGWVWVKGAFATARGSRRDGFGQLAMFGGGRLGAREFGRRGPDRCRAARDARQPADGVRGPRHAVLGVARARDARSPVSRTRGRRGPGPAATGPGPFEPGGMRECVQDKPYSTRGGAQLATPDGPRAGAGWVWQPTEGWLHPQTPHGMRDDVQEVG